MRTGMARWRARLVGVAVALLAAGSACGDELRYQDVNSLDASEACVPAVRADSGDPGAEVENANHASVDGGVVTGPFVVHGRVVTYRCTFTFDFDAQRYTITGATRVAS